MIENPYEADIVGEDVQDIYCPDCDLEFIECDVTWFSNRSLGSAICPNCERDIEVIPDSPEPDYEWILGRGVWTEWQ